MNTREYYKSLIAKDIMDIPDESLPYFFTMLSNLKDSIIKGVNQQEEKSELTGFCGAWEDDRPVEEIIADIESGRNYFSCREDQ